MMPDEKQMINTNATHYANYWSRTIIWHAQQYDEIIILHIMNSNDIRLQMLRNAYSTGQMHDLDLNDA